MKKYDSYKDSGVEWIGDIPSEWECIRLGMLGDFSSSGIDKKSKENETPVRMVNYTDLIQSRKYYPIQTGDKEYMRVTTPQSKLEEHRLKKGDMVFIPSSETHEDLGYSSLIDFDENDIVYSYHILRYITKKPVYHYYKKYLINHHSVLNQFSSECKGTTRQIIGRDVFNNVRVVLPPLSEQQQIVSFLDTKTSLIDSLIEKTQRKIELLKEKRTSLINEVVTKGLNPNVEMKDSGVDWIGEIPSHWVKTNVRMLIGKGFLEIQDGNHGEIHPKSEDYIDDGIPFVMSNNLRDGIVDYESCKKLDKNLTDKLRIGFSKTGDVLLTHKGTIGRVSIVSDMDYPYIMLTPQVTYYRCLDNSISNRHLYYQFQSDFFQKEMDLLSSDGSTRKFIGIVDQRNLPLLIIPINEQQQIVEYLDEQTQLIDKTISIEEKRIELLKEYRQSLISEVVTGKRKVVE